MPLPRSPKFIDSLKEIAFEHSWIAVIGSALLYSVCSAFQKGWGGLGDGIKIIIAAAFIILVVAIADLMKDRQFVKLQTLLKQESVTVIRGKFGSTQDISVWSIVVGDVILLTTGQRVPADCLVLDGSDLEVRYQSPESDYEHAIISVKNEENEHIETDPFLFADSLITRGMCKAVVCRVGPSSSRGDLEEEFDTEVTTGLQTKLHNLESHFRKYSMYSSVAIFLLMTIMLIINAYSEETYDFTVVIAKLAAQINFIVVLFEVSVPEGLSLAIGVSLAFSVSKMYNDKLLVRKVDAPERMGTIEELLCDKTGTITKGDMRVVEFLCENKTIKNSRKNTFLNCELSEETMLRVKHSILFNTDAHVEMDATTYYPCGNSTDVAFLRFL